MTRTYDQISDNYRHFTDPEAMEEGANEEELPEEISHPGCGGSSVEVIRYNPYTRTDEVIPNRRWCMRCDSYFTV